MPFAKNVLLIGDSLKVRGFQRLLEQQGVITALAPDTNRALQLAKTDPPDGIVFILPVYWESIADFVKKIREQKLLEHTKLIYLGDFIESSDQLVLKQQGVYTMTLGPVPETEVVRFIIKTIGA